MLAGPCAVLALAQYVGTGDYLRPREYARARQYAALSLRSILRRVRAKGEFRGLLGEESLCQEGKRSLNGW